MTHTYLVSVHFLKYGKTGRIFQLKKQVKDEIIHLLSVGCLDASETDTVRNNTYTACVLLDNRRLSVYYASNRRAENRMWSESKEN